MTGLKILMILFIIGGVLFFSQQATLGNLSSVQAVFPGFSAFGAAMLASLWAYDGWNNMPMVAGEIKDPQKNIPLALGFGVLFIVIIYALINFCYFYALPFTEIVSANSRTNPTSLPVAAKAAEGFMGSTGIWYLGIAMMFSAVGAMNGSILTNARVPYAMAKDGLFMKFLAIVHPRSHSPYVAVIVQALISIILAFSGTFDQLTDYVVFASWIFYALVTSSVFVFRRTHANIARPYKAFGYPVIPIIFLVSAVLLLINTLWTSPHESMWGLIIIAIGVPFFYLHKKLKKV
jgi:APA family basic amino acid/polyamine antiporter